MWLTARKSSETIYGCIISGNPWRFNLNRTNPLFSLCLRWRKLLLWVCLWFSSHCLFLFACCKSFWKSQVGAESPSESPHGRHHMIATEIRKSVCCCVSIQKVINTVIPRLHCWVTNIFRGVLKLQDFFKFNLLLISSLLKTQVIVLVIVLVLTQPLTTDSL